MVGGLHTVCVTLNIVQSIAVPSGMARICRVEARDTPSFSELALTGPRAVLLERLNYFLI